MASPSLQAVSRDERRAASFRVLAVRVDAVHIGDVVVIDGSEFAWLVLLEQLGLRKFD